MCVYERVALFIILSAIVGLIELVLYYSYTSINYWHKFVLSRRVLLSVKHVDYQLNPAPWNQCSYIAEFPQVLPLDKWFPLMTQPYGICSEISWTFLGFSCLSGLLLFFYLILFSVYFANY